MFLAEGPQAVREALRTRHVTALFVGDDHLDRADEHVQAAADAGVPAYLVREDVLASLADTVTPQGVVAVCRSEPVTLDEALAGARLVVVCAQIRDPGNLGTVIRCADAFGADAVLVTRESVGLHNPKTVRASVGSIFHVPVVEEVAFAEAVARLKADGLRVLAADGGGEATLDTLGPAELARPTAWIMGNEAWGLPAEHAAAADARVAVPLYGQAESLNLATAAAVCLYATASAQHAVS